MIFLLVGRTVSVFEFVAGGRSIVEWLQKLTILKWLEGNFTDLIKKRMSDKS